MTMKTNLKFIHDKLQQNMPLLRDQFKVNSLELFGSYVRKEQKNHSDLDLLVTFTESPSLFKFVRLENYLSELLGVKVDLVMKDALKPNLKEKIINEAQSV